MSKVLRLCVECVYRGGGGGAIGAGTQPPYGCAVHVHARFEVCLLYTSPSPRDQRGSRMPSSA